MELQTAVYIGMSAESATAAADLAQAAMVLSILVWLRTNVAFVQGTTHGVLDVMAFQTPEQLSTSVESAAVRQHAMLF